MLKRLMHITVLLAFVISTMPSFVVAMPMMDHKTIEHSDSQHKQHHHAAADMETDHSCCMDQTADNQNNKEDYKKCCDGDCQCVMNGCAKTQSLYHASIPAFTASSNKRLFITSNENHDDFIAYQLKRPPKA